MRNSFAILALALAIPAFTVPALAQPAPAPAQSSPLPTDPPHRDWHAFWITHPTAPLREPLVLHFRRTLTLSAVPPSYIVRVSADNRFILFVNGQRVGDGPARGDLDHWRYERFDLAPYLHTGQNLIAATVWNWGVLAPVAQITSRTAFLLESEAPGADSISTPNGWLVEEDPGRTPLPRSTLTLRAYYASGPGEKVDAAQTDWSWDSSTSTGQWIQPGNPMRESAYPGTNRARSADTTDENPWGLLPNTLPHQQYTPINPGHFVSLDSANEQPGLSSFPASPVTLPPHSHIHLLLDRGALTTAFPALTVSGGKGSTVWLTYSEALFDDHFHKGDRDATTYTDAKGVVHPRRALGLRDEFLPDGASNRTFQPLWWRTWRYLDLDITTGDQPLTLDALTAHFTAYPFVQRATFSSPDTGLAKIWQISWRTARLDAHETYMDTPYYEQLQYVGDTRIQALISYAVANDDRLALQALQAFNDSRIPEGITRSRYPSAQAQNIPTFSLLWIGMLHDYWMYRPNPAIVRESLTGVRGVLAWFAQHQQPDGLLDKLPWWSFIDWVPSGQTPTYSRNGESCITTLEYLGALNDDADLEASLGDPILAARSRERAMQVRSGIYKQCWTSSRGLLADNPDKTVFSQQANILGVLYDVIPAADQKTVLRKILAIQPGTTPNGTLSASYYFRFYLSRALDHAGMANDYIPSIEPWRQLLALHFSTWPETPGVTRSDSHAWSAHPIYDLLTLVAGIQPASPGFRTVRIAPHLGPLPSLTATFPHPSGEIRVEYHRTPSGLSASITLPAGLYGSFVHGGRTQPLHPGLNRLTSASAARAPKVRAAAAPMQPQGAKQ